MSVMEGDGIGVKVLLPREVTASWGDRCQEALFKTMTELSSAKLCISAKGEFYPGTTERVVLVSGTLDHCRRAVKLFVSLLSSASSPSRWDPAAIDISAPLDQTSYLVMRVTVPRAAGGTILGRQGSHVRAMQDVTGARVHASDKKDVVLRDERMLTIAGSAEACCQCLGLVFKRLAELGANPENPFLAFLNPEAEQGQAPSKGGLVERTSSTDGQDQALVGGAAARPTSPTTSTTSSTVSDATTCPEREGVEGVAQAGSSSSSSAAVAEEGPSGGTLCHAQRRKGRGPGFDAHSHSSSSSSGGSSSYRGKCTGAGSGADAWASGNGANSWQLSYPPLASYRPHFSAAPHYAPQYGGHPGGDHCAAYYGQAIFCPVPGPGAPHYPLSYSPYYSSWVQTEVGGGPHHYQQRQHQPRQNQYHQHQYQSRSAPPPHSFISSSPPSSQQLPLPPLQRQQQGQQGQQQQGQHIVIRPRNFSGAATATADIDDRVYTVTTIHMSVPDELMGAVFGKCGASLKEIQHKSQANVVVSSRGEYEPGTMNRRVTISGSPTNARHALLLIQKRIETDTSLGRSSAGLCARPALPVDSSVFIDDDKTTDEGGEVRAESSDSDEGESELQSKRPPPQSTSRREAKV